jgi:hypothetical protein
VDADVCGDSCCCFAPGAADKRACADALLQVNTSQHIRQQLCWKLTAALLQQQQSTL